MWPLQALLVRDTTDLDLLVAAYRRLLREATDLIDHMISLRRRGYPVKSQRLTVVPLRFGRWGLEKYGPQPVRLEALAFYRDRLVELWREIGVEQETARAKFTPTAFVTFRTRRAQVGQRLRVRVWHAREQPLGVVGR